MNLLYLHIRLKNLSVAILESRKDFLKDSLKRQINIINMAQQNVNIIELFSFNAAKRHIVLLIGQIEVNYDQIEEVMYDLFKRIYFEEKWKSLLDRESLEEEFKSNYYHCIHDLELDLDYYSADEEYYYDPHWEDTEPSMQIKYIGLLEKIYDQENTDKIKLDYVDLIQRGLFDGSISDLKDQEADKKFAEEFTKFKLGMEKSEFIIETAFCDIAAKENEFCKALIKDGYWFINVRKQDSIMRLQYNNGKLFINILTNNTEKLLLISSNMMSELDMYDQIDLENDLHVLLEDDFIGRQQKAYFKTYKKYIVFFILAPGLYIPEWFKIYCNEALKSNIPSSARHYNIDLDFALVEFNNKT